MLNVSGFTAGAFGENGYLATCERTNQGVIIDPGACADALVEAAKDGSVDIQAVLLTHAHLDHVEGLPTVLDAYSVPVHLHADDRPLYDAVGQQAVAFGMAVPDLPPPDAELKEGTPVRFGEITFAVRHAPGHAPGHVLFHAEEASLAFVGDVIFAGSVGRTDLPGGDYRVLFQSIREKVLTLPGDTRLLTGHGPETTVAWEAKTNPFLTPQYGGDLA